MIIKIRQLLLAMKTFVPVCVLACALGLLAVVAETAEKKSDHAAMAENHVTLNQAEMQWGDAPAAFPAGAKFAVLQGDPSKKGVYTVRLMVPDGYKIPPHTHPTTENVTVVSGAMNFGMGGTFDESAGKKIEAGGFASMPAKMKHFAWATGETVVQVHGDGPFQIDYVNPADDPRNAKK